MMIFLTEYEITETMLRLGGSFVQALARCFRLADSDNQARLLAAFPEYFAKYRELALLEAKRAASEKAEP